MTWEEILQALETQVYVVIESSSVFLEVYTRTPRGRILRLVQWKGTFLTANQRESIYQIFKLPSGRVGQRNVSHAKRDRERYFDNFLMEELL